MVSCAHADLPKLRGEADSGVSAGVRAFLAGYPKGSEDRNRIPGRSAIHRRHKISFGVMSLADISLQTTAETARMRDTQPLIAKCQR
jgi:hypothetical protein